MSETEDLKTEAEVQAMNQKMQGISNYLDTLLANSRKTLYWSRRSDILQIASISGYSCTVFVGLILNCPTDILQLHMSLMLGVAWMAVFRSWILNREFQKAEAEWKGAITILELLGMIPPLRERGTEDKKESWSEMAETVKGWFTSKKAAQEKAYAPV